MKAPGIDVLSMCILLLFSTVISSSDIKDLEIETKKSDPLKYRLPGGTVPTSYKVFLTLDPSKETFEGNVEIDIHVIKPTNKIVLHNDGLNIIDINVTSTTISNIVVDFYSTAQNDTNFLEIFLKSIIPARDEYKLLIKFDGMYSKELNGIYRSFYVDETGKKTYLATTQFAAVSARKAFPCYDEPATKSSFTFIIKAPMNYNVLSNTKDVAIENTPDGLKKVTFKQTPLMSTYILGFLVSDFPIKSLTDNPASTTFKAYSRTAVLEDMTFALKVAENSISELTKYLDFKYRLPKMDIVAVPDFKFSAMENWGIVDYKEEVIVFNERESSAASKQATAKVISHENAHMWFGNEVTPDWWGYVWMKEGFATYFENYITDALHKSWKIMDQFVPDVLQNSMTMDSFPTTNPMSSTVGSPSELMYNYNSIAYQKGASVIRLIRNIFGEENFREALSKYVKKLATGVTDPSKLYQELQLIADIRKDILPENVTVEEIFETWIDQPGYPLIYASRTGDEVKLIQSRYHLDRSIKTDEKWWIPIRVTSTSSTADSEISKYYFMPPNKNGTITLEEKTQWYLLDPQKSGYYRILYDEENWKSLTKTLKKKEFSYIFHPVDRAQLIDDVFEFSKTGRLHYNITMDLLQYLENEENYVPWISASRGLNHLSGIMTHSPELERYQKFVRNITSNLYKSVGFDPKDDDSHTDRLKRSLIVGLTCGSKNEDCMERKNEVAYEFLIDVADNKIHPDLRANILCSIVSIGETQHYDTIYELYNKYDRSSDKVIALKALGCANKEVLIEKNLLMSIDSEDKIRNHNRLLLVNSVISSGSLGLEKTLKFLYENFTVLQTKATVSTGLSKTIEALGNNIHTPTQISLFTMLIVKYKSELSFGEERAVLNAMDTIHLHQKWLNTSRLEIDQWLIENIEKENTANCNQGTYLLLCLPIFNIGLFLIKF